MASYMMGRIDFGERTADARKMALEKSDAVLRFSDQCAQCAYCEAIVYFTAGRPYALECLAEHLKNAHGRISIGAFGELSAPGIASTPASVKGLSTNASLRASDAFKNMHGVVSLAAVGGTKTAADELLYVAANHTLRSLAFFGYYMRYRLSNVGDNLVTLA
ncbi:uncharacterized protein SCHCODRAFT_01169662 [Schizophyllum commune H4-8]|uniref:Uncharacterized protein n=1 Tax=Schizophyllum commune (strain H4-8 / FGSC 9210) TaxID=578458 RepID=D8Q0X9_SCHCM|nr:uncharacterized protein SCHCODRAFT_01169662 [Schizophyllum commune H4-8]KAI5895195.1 hypothetical protein SCHCODRAFT_01169662 [Schizophyllum commune H4-8]